MAYSYVRYTGNGSTTNYTFSFPTISTDHIKVRVNGTLVTNWSFLSASTIQFAAAPANAAVIEIRRETPKDSSIVNFTDGSVLLERDLDLLATWQLYVAQETEDDLEDTIRVDSLGRFDALNKRIINVTDPVAAQDAVTKNWLETTYTSELDAIALAAASSASAAAGSASAATTQATNAAASAVSAANSAAAAATALDNFDDRYLGQKASNPTVDNDGNALLTGALYYNTTDSAMRVYTGSGWINASSAQIATMKTYVYVATAGQTVFSGTDANGSSLTFVAPYIIVSLNGLELRPTVDYTMSGGSGVTLTSSAASGDELQIQAFSGFNVADLQSSNVNWQQSGTGAVPRTVDVKLREHVSVFDFMSSTELASVQSYNFAVDVTTACQNALNAAHASKRNLYFPAGGYLVTSLTIPGDVQTGVVDDRDKGFRIFGQGFGEPFVQLNTGGTVIKSVSNAPVLKDILGTTFSSNGTVEIDHIRFDGTSTTPVVLLDSFYGMSSFHDCVIYQRGTGSGLRITFGATWHVRHCYSMNKDWNSYTLGAARTGIGFDIPMSYDNGLQTISKCSSRGWLTAYQLGGGAGTMYSPKIENCECSVVYNGIRLFGTRKAVIDSCYIEGGDGGIGIYDEGNFTTISNNLIFPGFSKAIDASNTSTQGTAIEKNIIGLGAVVNAIGIDVQSTASSGGYNKNVENNSISYTAGTSGVNGVKVQGTDPRINIIGNMFDPRGNWTGSGTAKINDVSSNGVYGLIQKQLGEFEIPVLSHGAVAFQEGQNALTQANVSGTTLTIPNAGSYFSCNATSACTVQSISAGVTPGRVVVFRTDTANMTFQDTAYIQLAGGVSFTGPGTLTLMVDRIGASNFAYEIARAVF